jgi:hypothetical protein
VFRPKKEQPGGYLVGAQADLIEYSLLYPPNGFEAGQNNSLVKVSNGYEHHPGSCREFFEMPL